MYYSVRWYFFSHFFQRSKHSQAWEVSSSDWYFSKKVVHSVAWLEDGYCSITVSNLQLITIIRFISKNYIRPWKDFANRLHLVLHAEVRLFVKFWFYPERPELKSINHPGGSCCRTQIKSSLRQWTTRWLVPCVDFGLVRMTRMWDAARKQERCVNETWSWHIVYVITYQCCLAQIYCEFDDY